MTNATDTAAICIACDAEYRPEDGQTTWEVWTLDEDNNVKIDHVGHCSKPCIHA